MKRELKKKLDALSSLPRPLSDIFTNRMHFAWDTVVVPGFPGILQMDITNTQFKLILHIHSSNYYYTLTVQMAITIAKFKLI